MLPEIQRLRGWGIIAVIVVHVTAFFSGLPTLSPLSFCMLSADVIAHCGVPIFVFISGFVLALKYYDNFDIIKFYIKRAVSIIPLYIISIYLYKLTQIDPFHLWFVQLIIEFYIIYPLLIWIYRKIGGIKFLAAMAGFQLYYSVRPFSSEILPMFIFIFYAGIYAARNYASIKQRLEKMPIIPLIALSTIPVGIIIQFWIYNYYGPIKIESAAWEQAIWQIYYILSIIILFSVSIRVKIFEDLGNYSYEIYLIHIMFMSIVINKIAEFGIYGNQPEFYILGCSLTPILSYAAAKIVSNSYGRALCWMNTAGL